MLKQKFVFFLSIRLKFRRFVAENVAWGKPPAMVPRPIAMDHHDHDEHAWQVGRYTAQLQDILRKQRPKSDDEQGRRHEN